MIKRIVSIMMALVLVLGCVFALAETVAATEPAEATAEATAEAPAAEEATEAPAAEEATEAPAAPVVEGKTRYISAPSGLLIREAPDLKAKVIATPDFNYAVKVIGTEGKWSHVIFETGDRVFEGYAWSAYLSPKKTVLKPVVKAAEATDENAPEEPSTSPDSEDSNPEGPVPTQETGTSVAG